MTAIKNISIPQPCHQSWQQMTTADKGRHCADCCKTVVDFTEMSDYEIIKHLSAKTNVCGRIQPQQLNNINYNLYAANLPSANWWKRMVIIIGMLGPLTIKVSGQTKPNIISMVDTSRSKNKTQQNDFVNGKVMVDNSHIIKGVVTANDDGLPIPGVAIKIKGKNVGTVTNTAGAFVLSVPDNHSTLIISSVGYIPQTITISSKDAVKPLHIVLKSSFMGGIAITREPNSLWRKVKTRFGTYSEPSADSSLTIKSTYY